MTKEYTYDERSWEATTRKIKQHFGINCLTPELAKAILALYIKGVGVTETIKQLEEIQ